MQVILVSGLSGSGKSIVLNVLEDAGYYCVDNLPVEFLPSLIELLNEEGRSQVAISVDARTGHTLSELPQQVHTLRHQGIDVRVLFLEANTETLVKRYSETRRRHPLSDGRRTLPECVEAEREALAEIGELGHHIDTSELTPNTLRSWVKDFLALDRSRITLLFESFGFKHGLPLDADFVFDVRCVPNPYYDPRLRPLTGLDAPVIEFLEQQEAAVGMLADIRYFIEKWLPAFVRDNRAYLTVAIGCTGGQHRSVYFAERLAERFRNEYQVLVRHRGLAS
ncbi:MAG: RNase adapter RapZ [Burkholderiales bacterium]